MHRRGHGDEERLSVHKEQIPVENLGSSPDVLPGIVILDRLLLRSVHRLPRCDNLAAVELISSGDVDRQ